MTEETAATRRAARQETRKTAAAAGGEKPKRAAGQARTKRAADEPRIKRVAGEPRTKRAAAEGSAKPEVTAHELIYLVSRIAASFEAILKAKEPALTLSQWAVLEMLAQDNGTARPSTVARKLGFSRQLIRQVGKKLMSLELVAAAAPDDGKKAVSLTLSDAGRKALTDIGVTTEAASAALKADKRGGAANQTARALKGLQVALAAQAPSDVAKTDKAKTGKAKKAKSAAETPVADALAEDAPAAA